MKKLPKTSIIEEFMQQAERVILGKQHVIKQALCCILARGHLLIEDIPGVGKTTLVKTIATLLGLNSTRIQFTNDLLPADIIGVTVYDKEKAAFRFHPGPLFTEVVIADELNRATPKTQSACLQAMEEGEVSVDGTTYNLTDPFIVVATQNPNPHTGTFSLPESQLDRFMMKLSIGYPNRIAEKKILTSPKSIETLNKLQPVTTRAKLKEMQGEVDKIFVSDEMIENLQNIVEKTRILTVGLSTRASLAFLNAAKGWAYLNNRNFVIPEDFIAVASPIMTHRIFQDSKHTHRQEDDLLSKILDSITT